MASGLRLSDPGRAWVAFAALLGAGSVAGWFVPASSWDWQPGLVASEPWRCWSAAFVHWSERHLAFNLVALAVVAAFGAVAGAPLRSAIAWFGAWPLTQLALVFRPGLLHYGGLSGVLHAGVAAAAVAALRRGGRQRVVGAAVLVGLAFKIVVERPWGPALVFPPDWDIAVAPLAHASGAAAGLLLGWLLQRGQSAR